MGGGKESLEASIHTAHNGVAFSCISLKDQQVGGSPHCECSNITSSIR